MNTISKISVVWMTDVGNNRNHGFSFVHPDNLALAWMSRKSKSKNIIFSAGPSFIRVS